MRLPRDVSGSRLAHSLQNVGYSIVKQTGSHIRLSTSAPTEPRITIPNHDPIKIGTRASILDDVSKHLEIDRAKLLGLLKL